ncbi:MAG: DUF2179 domain-containing protein [Candidatus Omnitrophota bacterium]
MSPIPIVDSPAFAWIILPLLIFLARICDVAIGTIRIITLYKGRRFLAPLLGFVEILIWLAAIRQIMQNLSNVYCYFAYAGGFAMGIYVGMYIEEKLAFGYEVIRVITKNDAAELIQYLRSQNYGVTNIDAQGASGKVSIIFTIVNRSARAKVISFIKRFNPKAFYTIEDIRSVSEGVFPPGSSGYLNRLFGDRKCK